MFVVDENKVGELQTIKRQNPIKLNSVSFQIQIFSKDVEKNMERIKVSLKGYKVQDKLDLIIFPELGLTGSAFKSEQDVKPFSEQQCQGKIFNFLSQVAKSLNTYVVCGYPEQYINEKKEEFYYNSAYLIGRNGELVQNIRKKHLFAADLKWANPAEQFSVITLKNHENINFKVSIGIGQDINPIDFKDGSTFEWGDFLRKEEIDAVVHIQNWIDNEPERDDSVSIKGLIDYFTWRLRPLVNLNTEVRYQKQWVYLSSNRVGKEVNPIYGNSQEYYCKNEENIYCGCSVSLKLNPEEVIYNLDKRNEQILKSEVKLE